MSKFKEPWYVQEASEFVNDSTDFPVTQTYFQSTFKHDEEIRERIVACVNACAGMENPAAEISKLREEVKRLRGEYGPKQDYSNAPLWEIKELDLIFATREQEGTNYLYKSKSGYHGFKDKLSKQDMEKGSFRLIWSRDED
jgi:hypothetical protein